MRLIRDGSQDKTNDSCLFDVSVSFKRKFNLSENSIQTPHLLCSLNTKLKCVKSLSFKMTLNVIASFVRGVVTGLDVVIIHKYSRKEKVIARITFKFI